MAENIYNQLCEHMKEIMLLGNTMGILGWDMRTYMPSEGTMQRAQQLALLSGITHDRLVSEKTANLLKKSGALDLTSLQKRNLELWQRDYEQETKLSVDLVKKLTMQRSITEKLWEKAKAKSDFKMVQAELEKLVELVKEQATALNPDKSMYDVLLDLYEKNITEAMISTYFSELKKGVMNLLEKTRNIELNPDILKIHVSVAKQKDLSKFIIKFLNMPTERSRLDETVHPFTTGYADDIRITTNYLEKEPMASFYSVFHEAGHGLYGLNLPKEHRWTAVGQSTSMGIHESQSRFVENIIGKNPVFLEYAIPKIKEIAPEFKKIGTEDFINAVNAITPSKIRIYADEVTYNLHVILRFEIERELFAGKISVGELPQIWNNKIEEYLGIEIKDDAEGVLQDVHWYGGLFGYFPDYALGNIYNGQMLYAMEKKIPDWNDQLSIGNAKNILNWLDIQVHKRGFLYDPADLVKEITGELPDAKYFVKYMNEKFGKIYKL
jgi:carboxypeptidase Taq